MSIEVEKYLRDLDRCNLNMRLFKNTDFMLYLDSNNHKLNAFPGFSKNGVERVDITLPHDRISLYLKRFYTNEKHTKEAISNEIVFSRLYNALGVNAVKAYPIILSRWSEKNSYGMDVAIGTENLNSIRGIHCEPFSSDIEFYKFIRKYNLNIEKILAHQDEFVESSKHPESARSLIANYVKTSMLDIICMLIDNHMGNKNIVRYNRKPFEDVVSYDFEDSHLDKYCVVDFERFDQIINNGNHAFEGEVKLNSTSLTYMDYLSYMKKIMEDGALPPECVELIKNIIELNFDDVIRDSENSTGFHIPQYKKDYFQKLIDVNQEFFSR